MGESVIKKQLINEINNLPDEGVAEIYRFVHDFSNNKHRKSKKIKKILSFSGSWKDLDDNFLSELAQRRKSAFHGRGR